MLSKTNLRINIKITLFYVLKIPCLLNFFKVANIFLLFNLLSLHNPQTYQGER